MAQDVTNLSQNTTEMQIASPDFCVVKTSLLTKVSKAKKMKIESNYQRQVGLFSMLSAILAFGSLWLSAVAVEFNLDTFSDPSGLLYFSQHHEAARWAMLLDMFGYYLLLLPAILYLHEWLAPRTPWANLLTCCGLAYVLVGAIGAGILAAVWPQQMQQYLVAGPEQQVALRAASENITTIVYGGMWNILEVFLCGVWWTGLGLVLRPQFRSPGNVSILLGAACLLDSAGNMTGIKILAETGLNIYLILAIVWAAWMGVLMFKNRIQI